MNERDEAETNTPPTENTRTRSPYQKINSCTKTRIIEALENGSTVDFVSKYENLSKSTICSIRKRYIENNCVVALPRGGKRFEKVSNEIKEEILSIVNGDCTLSLQKISHIINSKFNIRLSRPTIFNQLKSMHYTLKVAKVIPERRNCDEVLAERRVYAQTFLEIEETFPASKIIFLDEVGFSVSMRTKFGRAPIGVTPNITVPNIRTKNISVCCAISRNTMLHKKISHSSYNAEKLNVYILEVFEILRNLNLNNCCFIMDNVAFHKCSSIRNLFSEHNHRLVYLPPYSPSFNIIETAFSKWKNYVKRENCKNEKELFEAMERGFLEISNEDCDGFYRLMKRELRKASDGDLL
jgi:transposase